MASRKISIINKIDNEESEMGQYTLMNALERIVLASLQSGLEDKNLNKADKALCYVCSKTGLSRFQAIIFAICVEQSFDPVITMTDIRRWIECPMITLLKHQKDVDELVEKGFLWPSYDKNGSRGFEVPENVIECLNDNDFSAISGISNLSFEEFFDKMGEYFLLRRQCWSFDELAQHIKALVDSNLHLNYCQKMSNLPGIENKSVIILHYFCHRLINFYNQNLNESRLYGILPKRADTAIMLHDFINGEHPLVEFEFIEMTTDEGFIDVPRFQLTNMAKQALLVEGDKGLLDVTPGISQNEMLLNDTIKEKRLFYGEGIDEQVNRLSSLLYEDNYQEICQRLEEQGLRKGFACLFYGKPGTGKTETALQLARMTGRNIMQVDISGIRSKWVGESQKLVKGIFDRYSKAVKNSIKAPILLLNEADGLLSIRKSNPEGSVDKMENAMQNIFLQEMENMEGILIATTNLSHNLDQAFERRFLYKIEFKMPDADCRTKIWKSMIEDLTEEDAKILALKYEFSGAQIENVRRKQIVDSILYGQNAVTASSILSYCDAEHLNNTSHRPMGFCV